MKRMVEEHSEHKLKAIWIGFQDRIDRLQVFSKKHGLESVGFDRGNKVATSYGISYGAGVIFINSSGMVQDRFAKGFSYQTIKENMGTIITEADKDKSKDAN